MVKDVSRTGEFSGFSPGRPDLCCSHVRSVCSLRPWGDVMSIRNYAAYLKPVALAAAFAASAVGAVSAADMMPVKAAPPPPFFLVNDTWVSFTWYPKATDPGVSGNNI